MISTRTTTTELAAGAKSKSPMHTIDTGNTGNTVTVAPTYPKYKRTTNNCNNNNVGHNTNKYKYLAVSAPATAVATSVIVKPPNNLRKITASNNNHQNTANGSNIDHTPITSKHNNYGINTDADVHLQQQQIQVVTTANNSNSTNNNHLLTTAASNTELDICMRTSLPSQYFP